MSVLVLTAGIVNSAGLRPPGALQPATVTTARVGARRRFRLDLAAAAPLDDDDDQLNIITDSLQALGLMRRRIDRPVVGRKAYVRLWERLRALVVLAAIIAGLGVALAGVIGAIVLGAAFVLEQAVS